MHSLGLEHCPARTECHTLTSFSKLLLAMLLIFDRSYADAEQAVMVTVVIGRWPFLPDDY